MMLDLMTTILRTDSYKISMSKQYAPGTTHISSYVESRGGEDESVFFGLQAFIKEYLMTPITAADIDSAEAIITTHGYEFNRAGWELILNEHNGFLPIKIQAVREGTVMPTHNVQVQLVNTDPRLPWITTYVETALLRAIWFPSTITTKSRKMKKIIANYLKETSDIPVADQIAFALHDFSARGVSSSETAALGGMAHLVNFMGTDNIEGVVGAMKYYGTGVSGYSIPASEHSTITSWGRENEAKAFENMIDQFAKPGAIFACVSDSYNIWESIDLWLSLKNKLESSGAKLVIRPDSGDPTTVAVSLVLLIMSKFGFTVNSKGYKILPSYLKVIQGDGMGAETIPILLENMKKAKLSTENLAIGAGGGLIQVWNRDSLKYAMKASATRVNEGSWVGFKKEPITDLGKKSKAGRLALIYTDTNGYETIQEEDLGKRENMLRDVFENGRLLLEDNFETVRQRAAI